MRIRCLLVLVLLPFTAVYPQGGGHLIENPIRRIPKWVRTDFEAQHLAQRYSILYRLYPYYLRGDFNGDGKRDAAIQVQEITTGKIGMAVFHTKKPQALSTPVFILGAGKALGTAGDDLKWVDIWSVYPKAKVAQKFGKEGNALRSGDAIHVERRDSTGGLLYWDGKKYSWRTIRERHTER